MGQKGRAVFFFSAPLVIYTLFLALPFEGPGLRVEVMICQCSKNQSETRDLKMSLSSEMKNYISSPHSPPPSPCPLSSTVSSTPSSTGVAATFLRPPPSHLSSPPSSLAPFSSTATTCSWETSRLFFAVCVIFS